MRKTILIVLLFIGLTLAKEFPGPEIAFEFIPGDIYAGEASTGIFNIYNPKAQPVFDLTIDFWAPCGNETYPDWLPITNWTVSNPAWKDTRVLFSGILDERLMNTTYGINEPYLQCLYSFNFVLPKYADNFRGPAVLRPGEFVSISFTLQSLSTARWGTYDMSFDLEYLKPGRELAQIIKK